MSALTETTFLILLSLVPGARHGYAIIKDVTQLSQGRVNLSTGTLYTALQRLLETGWIEQVEEIDATRGRKAYRLTTTGRTAVHDETTRLTVLSTLAHRRLESTP
jgi:DNA-binding PadR family transcriptional regulator